MQAKDLPSSSFCCLSSQTAHSGLTLQPYDPCSPHYFLPSYSSPRFSVDSPGKYRDSENSATRSSRLPGEPVVGQSTTQWAPASPTSSTTVLLSPEVPEIRLRVKTAVEQRKSYAQALPDAEPEQGHCLTRTWLIQCSLQRRRPPFPYLDRLDSRVL